MYIFVISLIFFYFVSPILAVNTCSYTTCSCDKSTSRGYDIECPDSNTPKIKISMDLDRRLYGLNCRRNENYMNYLPKKYLPPDFEINKLDLDSIQFESCSLPHNTTIQDVMDYLKINSTRKLQIKYSTLLNITRNDLEGLEEIVTLYVISNVLKDLPDDLLYDLKNLREIDMSSNNVLIPQNFFKMADKLHQLELSRNTLPNNTTGMFDNLRNISRLGLWNMDIVNLDEAIFRNISTVKIIDLSVNKIESLPTNIFKQLTRLEELSLRKNNLHELPPGIFDNNINLRKLKLDENQNLSVLPPYIFKNLKNLDTITLNTCNLSTIEENTFSGLFNLKEINLYDNKIKNLPEKIFNSLRSLENLYLPFNDLEELPQHIFKDLINLKILDLSGNKLKLSYNTFSGLNNLNQLSLRQNQIKEIQVGIFSSLEQLKVLDMSNNELINLPTSDLSKLEKLLLKNNNISFMQNDWRISTTLLSELDISNNKFKELRAYDFKFLSKNIKINLQNNLIENINMDDAEVIFQQEESKPHPIGYKNIIVYLDGNPIHCSCNLYNLYRYYDKTMNPEVHGNLELKADKLLCSTPEDMNGTYVKSITSNNFICELNEENINANVCPKNGICYLKPINETLYIDYSNTKLTTSPPIDNNITKILTDKYKYLKNLKITLNISRNEIESFTEQNGGYDQITVLDLSHNRLKRINWFPKNTQYLYLHANNITTINSTELKVFNSSNLKKVTLFDNNWDCSCEAVDFLKYLQDNFKKVDSLYEIKCADTNVEVATLTVEQLCSLPQGILIYSLIIVAIFSLMITILSILFYRYNTEIKVWLYAHQYCLWWVTEEEIDKEKLYDAFISYSHKDEDFIVTELLPKLEEGTNPYKLCLHFRNWQPGEFITTNIARSIAESRRTIVILSPNFLESEWGKMEFRTAHTQALSEGRARVIIILLGDVPTDDLDEELKAYLSTNTYLKWGDPWFWNKLRYALPHQSDLLKPNRSQNHNIINIYDDKSDLMNDPNSPPIVSTPPADKINFEPELISNKALNMYLVNNTLYHNSLNNKKNNSIIA